MSNPSPTRILAIDDDPAMLTLFRAVLGKPCAGREPERLRMCVDTALSGAEGLELFRRAHCADRPYAIAFVDLVMPGMNGIETANRLWAVDPSLLVVRVTASEKALRMAELAVFEESDRLLSLHKPLHPVELRQVARFLDQRKRAEDALQRRTVELNERIEEMRRLQAELAQAQRLEAIGQLAAGIAHEINTPTQYIGDNTLFLGDAFRVVVRVFESVERLLACDGPAPAELLEQARAAARTADLPFLAEEIPRAVEQSLEGIGCVAEIVRAMKEFSHPGAESKVAVDLNRAVASTLTVCRNEWKYVADLTTDFDPALPPVPCLPGELNQAILNIVINAAHAIAEKVAEGDSKGAITVRTRRRGNAAEIHIEDTGTGIPQHLQPKIFDLFFTTKTVGRGTGQGLTMARSIIVEKHGGALSFHSEPGKGTAFIVLLPLEPAANQPVAGNGEHYDTCHETHCLAG